MLGIITAAFLPGISPYFLFPTLLAAVAALVLIATPCAGCAGLPDDLACSFRRRSWRLSIWIGLVATGETLRGLKLHELFTVTAAFAAMTLIPYANVTAMRRSVWLDIFGGTVVGALIATTIAGFQPAYSKTQAQRLSIRYMENAATNKPVWALDADEPLPPSLRAAADFSETPQTVLPPPFAKNYVAPAGATRFKAPDGKIVSDAVVAGAHRITIALHGSPEASGDRFSIIPKVAKIRAIDIHGEHVAAPKDNDDDTVIACASRDCASEVVGLEFASRAAFKLAFGEQRYGAPPSAAKLIAARPKNAIPSQNWRCRRAREHDRCESEVGRLRLTAPCCETGHPWLFMAEPVNTITNAFIIIAAILAWPSAEILARGPRPELMDGRDKPGHDDDLMACSVIPFGTHFLWHILLSTAAATSIVFLLRQKTRVA